jgi:nucleoid-associated protein YgaU
VPNDAKLGLVVGVGLLIVVAVVFFRKELTPGTTSVEPPSNRVQPPPPAIPPANSRIVSASPTARTDEKPEPRRHTVREGETLSRLAEQYLGDGARYRRIGEANGLKGGADEALPVGTVLVIPEADGLSP